MNTQHELNDNRTCSRRKWLASAGRWTALGLLGMLSVGLLARDHDHCHHCGPGGCGDCSELTKCRLPRAMETKHQTENKRDDDVEK
ncbi:MAG: hypothetical protein U9N87_10390 [Planctomycetota bacterium]|nr:hypothetical protein [Planctomycetota bacterium]